MTPREPDDRWWWDNEPCRAACPVHTDAGAYVTAIAEGRFREAYLIARAPNPFASICGRVCGAPCESSCRRGTVDAPVSIRGLKRFVTERFGVESFSASAVWHEGHGAIAPPSGHSVGIVGGGPAGLTAAHDLRLAGHDVSVYEAADRLGGMMVLGIPEYRLARRLVEREIAAILELGVTAHTGFVVGRDATFAALLERHDAVFLAVGAGRARDLDLPGHDLDGVLRAVEYLLNVNRGFTVDLGERVVVVGGGNVAFDAARTALRASASAPTAALDITTALDVARSARRAGVLDVTVLALESPEEIPADAEEIAQAAVEGITILYRRGPHRFVGADGRVSGLETIDVASVFDDQGRFSPTFVAGTERVVSASTVILAVGQTTDLGFLGDVALTTTTAGTVQIDETMRTSNPRVWAGGDVAHGPRLLIDAVADGRRAAASIDAVLAGRDPAPEPLVTAIELTTRRGFRRLDSAYDAIARVEMPTTATDRRIGFAEVEVGYDEDDATREALRCLRCFDNVVLDSTKCILCGLCVDVCPPNCITIVRADRIGVGGEEQSALLLDEDACIRCGLCVNRCPPSALSMAHALEVVS